MKKKMICLVSLLLLSSLTAFANPHDLEIFNNDKFAKPEMKNKCSVCHINPSGGGTRNEFGEAFEEASEKITNEIRKKFPELFNIPQGSMPKITRVRPAVFTVGKETTVTILGKNLTSDIILHVDGVSTETTHLEHTITSPKKIEFDITFNEVGKHTFHVATPTGQLSNIFKVKAKPAKS